MSRAETTTPRAGGLRASGKVGTGQGSNEANDTPEVRLSLCPRYERCSAPICPLDPEWEQRTHIKGEPVCGLLLELAKDGGEANLRGCLPGGLVDRMVGSAPSLLARWAPLRRAFERASKQLSKLRLVGRLRKEGSHE